MTATPRVILILIDGLRPDALAGDPYPHLAALKARSSYSLTAQSVMPSLTLPCHTSIFHSQPPERHGILTNDWTPMARPVRGLFDVATLAGKHCAFFYNWEQLRDIARPGSLLMSYCRNTSEGDMQSDLYIAETAAHYLRTEQPDFTFIYLGTCDTMGHAAGWMSELYLQHLHFVDAQLGKILEALPQDSIVLLQSDHGGHERTHGTAMPEDMTIPWMISGVGIRRDYAIQSAVSLLDSAPTLAYCLGIPQPSQWEGRIIEEVFVR
jgi:predicted AlkP superfamily pyrophosphatase or phosphodiesterase